MKRFPRAMTEALGLVGLVIVVSASCSPDQSVKPGAPVLTQLTILENGSTPTNITSDLVACKADTKTGDVCFVADNVVEGQTVDAMDATCKLNDADWCRCTGDASMSPMGTWNCDPFSPMSVVIATFDRLLDTDPIDPGDAGFRTDIATLTAVPTPAKPIEADTDYSSTGSDKGVVFNVFGPMFFGNYRSGGPSLEVVGSPALETGATISIQLQGSSVRAKDGKTPFTGSGFLKDGTLSFKTAAFSASITVPTQPPPDASADVDSGADANADGGVVADAAPSEAGVDATPSDAGVTDADVTDAGATDAAATEVAANDASGDASPVAPPEPGLAVEADMNMAPVTVTFNNLVDGTEILTHIAITEDGVAFTDFVTDTSKAGVVTYTPKTTWAAGKTYVVTVDANADDVVGDKLGAVVNAAFKMAN
jgi:Bacterial Ig-like domain